MAKSAYTFEFYGPTDHSIEQYTGEDTIVSSAPNISIRKVVMIEDSILADAIIEYEIKQWKYVGSGDQT